MMWKLLSVLPYLLATTAFVLPSVSSRSSDGLPQAAFGVQPESPTPNRESEWSLPPDQNSTHHLIFNSVSGLLQRWPNALRRNGHSLVPATIPKGTVLYHGRVDPQIPVSPDWVAFDFEHAYMFCRQSCHMISMQAKRDIRLVYFDGLSAAKMKDGTLDSQDVILWGRPRPDKYYSEMERIESLCDWGKPLGLDGFVRMEFNLCVHAITESPISPGSSPSSISYPRTKPPFPNVSQAFRFRSPGQIRPGSRLAGAGTPPSMRRGILESYLTGIWHDRAPGETRVRPDYSGLVTFYDPSLSSLVEARYGKDRLHLRLEGISELDSNRVRAELQTVLTRERDRGSGIDWGSIVRVVTDRYADRLEYLRFLLSPNTTTFTGALERAAVAREQLLVMLTPYITTANVPKQLPASANLSWAAPVVQRCATTQTSHIPLGMLTPQEARIHAAVENTLHEICRRLVLVWVEFFDVEARNEARATEATEVARGHIDKLMVWLDWSVWVRCEPGCSIGEFCYFPSWPYFQEDDPYNLTPRCRSFKDFAP
ncbi:hypothetical protein BJY52DRAFT_1186220 [Lactarius psammicola]|nr:hypothetical protein BJY52DRAFT_1186220 [Lactarius psammicola]